MNPKPSELSAGDPRIQMALDSEKMDFSQADAAPAQQLNEIVWKTVRGTSSVMPPPRFTLSSGKDDDDDDDK